MITRPAEFDPFTRDLEALKTDARRAGIMACLAVIDEMRSRFAIVEAEGIMRMTAVDACDLIKEEIDKLQEGHT